VNIFFKEPFLLYKRKSSVTLFIIYNIIDIVKFFVVCTSPAGLSCGHTQQQAKSLPLPQLAGSWKSGSGYTRRPGELWVWWLVGPENWRTGDPEAELLEEATWSRPQK